MDTRYIQTNDEAFGCGCDARIAGRPRSGNPFTEEQLQRAWDRGWIDVDRHWGREAKWPILDLPEAP